MAHGNDSKIDMVSLFCGAGGLDIGFENAGFHTVWANDFDADSCATHRSWSNAEVVQGDIAQVDINDIPATPIIVGGFPCQGFSLAGPRKIDDSRNILYRYFVNLVGEKQPQVFVAENVKGILTLGKGEIISAIEEDFSSKGYVVKHYSINAADYGVPQDRHRVIIIGINKDLGKVPSFPKKVAAKITLEDALRDVDSPSAEDICSATYSSRYMSRNRKRGWDRPSYTIPAMAKQVPIWPGSPDMVRINANDWHFGEGGLTRRLSWQEAAA